MGWGFLCWQKMIAWMDEEERPIGCSSTGIRKVLYRRCTMMMTVGMERGEGIDAADDHFYRGSDCLHILFKLVWIGSGQSQWPIRSVIRRRSCIMCREAISCLADGKEDIGYLP